MTDYVKKVKPFVKWAGGKRGLINTFEERGFFPNEFNNYYEPMLGGGAVFFHMVQNYSPNECILSDINPDLIETYQVIKNTPEKLINELKKVKKKYESEKHQKEFFYAMREYFNFLKLNRTNYELFEDLKGNIKNITTLESIYKYFNKIDVKGNKKSIRKTALFIFLNKTCYNGLYRVNSKGEFNVPYGRYKNPRIFSEKNIKNASSLLDDVTLLNQDFEIAVETAKENDFVYFDPPYIPITDTAYFTSYSKNDFEYEEQKRLAKVVNNLTKKGCYVMESNSESLITRDIYDGYEKLNIHVVEANRSISCKGDKRDSVEEVVILGNYEPVIKQKKLID